MQVDLCLQTMEDLLCQLDGYKPAQGLWSTPLSSRTYFIIEV